KDTKGMRYIAALLARPGVEVHAMELAASVEDARVASSVARREVAEGGLAMDEGAGDDVLDERAKAEFRLRLDELRDELEEAERVAPLTLRSPVAPPPRRGSTASAVACPRAPR